MQQRVLRLLSVIGCFIVTTARGQVQFIDTGITYVTLSRAGINASGLIFVDADDTLRLRSPAGAVTTVAPPPGFVAVHAGSINAAGAIGGSAKDSGADSRAIIRRPDGSYLFPIASGESFIGGINDAGDAAGWTGFVGSERPFRYTAASGIVSTLNRPAGANGALGRMINNGGVIGGLAAFPSGPSISTARIIRYAVDGSGSVMPGPLTLGSDALDINSAGDIAGSVALVPIVWNADGSTSTLGGTGIAIGINDVGDVVGSILAGQGLAVSWDAFGTPINLNDFLTPAQRENWRLFAAWDVNNSHTIVGEAKFDPDGAAGPLPAVNRVFLLTIPEPSLAGVLSIVSLIFTRTRRCARGS